MCIICQIKKAGISEEALELVESLAELAVTAANGLGRFKAQGALLDSKEELALLAGRVMFEDAVAEDDDAPEGVTPQVWQAMPQEVRQMVSRAITNGAKLQVVSLSDTMPDETIAKH